MNKLNRLVLIATLPAMLITGAALAESAHDANSGNMKHHQMKKWGDDQFFKGLNLTDAQKAQIKEIRMTDKKSMTEADKASMSKQHQADVEAFQKLIQADTFDESAVRKLAQDGAQRQIDFRVMHAKIQHDIYAILTPEQKAIVAKKQAERAQKRHNDM